MDLHPKLSIINFLLPIKNISLRCEDENRVSKNCKSTSDHNGVHKSQLDLAGCVTVQYMSSSKSDVSLITSFDLKHILSLSTTCPGVSCITSGEVKEIHL